MRFEEAKTTRTNDIFRKQSRRRKRRRRGGRISDPEKGAGTVRFQVLGSALRERLRENVPSVQGEQGRDCGENKRCL